MYIMSRIALNRSSHNCRLGLCLQNHRFHESLNEIDCPAIHCSDVMLGTLCRGLVAVRTKNPEPQLAVARRSDRGALHASWIPNWLILVAVRGNFLRGEHKLETKNTYEPCKGYFLTFNTGTWPISRRFHVIVKLILNYFEFLNDNEIVFVVCTLIF